MNESLPERETVQEPLWVDIWSHYGDVLEDVAGLDIQDVAAHNDNDLVCTLYSIPAFTGWDEEGWSRMIKYYGILDSI